MATLRKASFVRTTGLLKYFALASLVVAAASCGGSDESSDSRQRNSAISEPVVATYDLETSPGDIVLDDDGNAFVIGTSEKVIKVSKDGTVSDFASLSTNPDDIAIDENGNIYTLNNVFVGRGQGANLTKFAKDGTVEYQLQIPQAMDNIAIASSKLAYASQRSSNSLVHIDLETRTLTMGWGEFGDGVSGVFASPAAVATFQATVNSMIIQRTPAGTSTHQSCLGMVDAKVTSTGKVLVPCMQSNQLLIVDEKSDETLIPLDASKPFAVDVQKDIAYVTSVGSNKVITVDTTTNVVTDLFPTGQMPTRIDANSSGIVVVLNAGSSSVTFYTPASTSGGTLEQMPSIEMPMYGPVTRTADGFTLESPSNYDANQLYSAVSNAGTVAVGEKGELVVTGLGPGQAADVTVRVERPGYAPYEGALAGNALNAALKYTFGSVTPTVDGFTVPITDLNADWETKVRLNPSTADATLNNDGILTVSGLNPDTDATVDVYSIRPGYVTGVSSINGRSAPAGQAPESSESEQQQGTPVEEITSSEIPQVDASSPTTMVDTPAPTTADATTTTGAEQQGVTAATITSNNTTVAAVPPAAIENSVPVIVPAGTTEITCDDACVDALLTYAGSTGGTVTASVAGAAPVPVEKGSPTVLAVGDKDTSIAFTVTGDDGKETVVDVPVVQASQSVVTPKGESDSGSNSAWIWVILVLVLLLIVFLLKKRRQNDSATN